MRILVHFKISVTDFEKVAGSHFLIANLLSILPALLQAFKLYLCIDLSPPEFSGTSTDSVAHPYLSYVPAHLNTQQREDL